MTPEQKEDHRQDMISQYDRYVMSGKSMDEYGGYKPTNFGHGNKCRVCNDAIIYDMEKTRGDHFKEGTLE
jgi:hypothetical protein